MILAKRNFHVVLFEKRERLGGQMYLASLPPHRAKIPDAIHEAFQVALLL